MTRFLAVHDIGHSFVNPVVYPLRPETMQDSMLFHLRLPSVEKLLQLESGKLFDRAPCAACREQDRRGKWQQAGRDKTKEPHVATFHFMLTIVEKITAYEKKRNGAKTPKGPISAMI